MVRRKENEKKKGNLKQSKRRQEKFEKGDAKIKHKITLKISQNVSRITVRVNGSSWPIKK